MKSIFNIHDERRQGEVLLKDKPKAKENSKNFDRKFYIESYGCAMNFNDSEIVASILEKEGFGLTDKLEEADLVFVNTCSIRAKAEDSVRKRLEKYNAVKRDENPSMKVGVLGCMAERLKTKLLEEEHIVDLVAGPDAYKDLPNLVREIDDGRDAVNVILSKDETYGDISPVRLQSDGVTAFVSITRGCDNMCTFCVVPFTRGRERSRAPESIVREVNELGAKGYKEVTLLGQNVDSYLWYGGGMKKDFKKATPEQKANAIHFAGLLEMVALAQPKMRIRFSTSNPQDMTMDVVDMMAKYENICKYIHLPVQSGSNRILKAMNRQHTREEYFELIDNIRKRIPDCGISFDMMTGFSGETEEDHQETLDLMKRVKYDFGYMFAYSERPGTLGARKLEDDVPEKVKKRRLSEVIELQQKYSKYNIEKYLGQTVEVLVEKESKKSDKEWSGRNTQNVTVVFPKENYKVGDYVLVKPTDCTTATLKGKAVGYSDNQ